MNTYLTEFVNSNQEKYGWSVQAKTIEEAELLVKERGIGEIIVGQAS